MLQVEEYAASSRTGSRVDASDLQKRDRIRQIAVTNGVDGHTHSRNGPWISGAGIINTFRAERHEAGEDRLLVHRNGTCVRSFMGI